VCFDNFTARCWHPMGMQRGACVCCCFFQGVTLIAAL
jgi:hypothetical protein